MIIPFNKYHGTGNDFIIIDNRKRIFNPPEINIINKLCDRRFGIGADGLILIIQHKEYDFEMKYFNADGYESSLCGNGGRCAAHFAYKHRIAGNKQKFLASDGTHEAAIEQDYVRLRMKDIKECKTINDNYFINTGSPHYIKFLNNAREFDVYNEGKKLRWDPDFAPSGTNVNFVEVMENGIYVRTFERGVENETLSCGTGVTASAIASVLSGHFDTNRIDVTTPGGKLFVEFEIKKKIITDIWLCGPATFVFEGEIAI